MSSSHNSSPRRSSVVLKLALSTVAAAGAAMSRPNSPREMDCATTDSAVAPPVNFPGVLPALTCNASGVVTDVLSRLNDMTDGQPDVAMAASSEVTVVASPPDDNVRKRMVIPKRTANPTDLIDLDSFMTNLEHQYETCGSKRKFEDIAELGTNKLQKLSGTTFLPFGRVLCWPNPNEIALVGVRQTEDGLWSSLEIMSFLEPLAKEVGNLEGTALTVSGLTKTRDALKMFKGSCTWSCSPERNRNAKIAPTATPASSSSLTPACLELSDGKRLYSLENKKGINVAGVGVGSYGKGRNNIITKADAKLWNEDGSYTSCRFHSGERFGDVTAQEKVCAIDGIVFACYQATVMAYDGGKELATRSYTIMVRLFPIICAYSDELNVWWKSVNVLKDAPLQPQGGWEADSLCQTAWGGRNVAIDDIVNMQMGTISVLVGEVLYVGSVGNELHADKDPKIVFSYRCDKRMFGKYICCFNSVEPVGVAYRCTNAAHHESITKRIVTNSIAVACKLDNGTIVRLLLPPDAAETMTGLKQDVLIRKCLGYHASMQAKLEAKNALLPEDKKEKPVTLASVQHLVMAHLLRGKRMFFHVLKTQRRLVCLHIVPVKSADDMPLFTPAKKEMIFS